MIPAYSGFRSGHVGQAYNEAAFRHFLVVNRRRAERSRRSLLLVLATIRQRPDPAADLPNATAAALFSGLGAVVRDVDFVGWYREGRVVGAVLVQAANAPVEAPSLVADRVVPALRKRLPADQSERLRVRVIRLGART